MLATNSPIAIPTSIFPLQVAPLQTQVQLLQAELQQRSTQAADLNTLTAQVRSLQAEVASLRPQAAMVPQLQVEINLLKQAVAALAQAPAAAPSEKSLGKARASYVSSSTRCLGMGPLTARRDEGSSGTTIGVDTSHATPAMPPEQGFPGIAPSLLGKRQRDSNDSHVTDVVEAGQVDHYNREDLEKRVVRPTKKRPKLSDQDEGQLGPSSSGEPAGTYVTGDTQSGPRGTRFTIFQGPEEPPESYIDPPPPTTHLSDLFPFDPEGGQITPPNGIGGAIPRPPGADENAPNQLPPNFNFSFNTSLFDPITSTPFDMNLPPFTYPEPPASPSPAAPSGGFVERAGGRIERNDLFQPLRRMTPAQGPSLTPSRPQSAIDRTPTRTPAPAGPSHSRAGAASSTTVDPSMLMATSALPRASGAPQEADPGPSVTMANGSGYLTLPRRTVSSTEVGLQLGMSSVIPLPPETPAAPMKRTMYGTELEGDTRFGDFGVEGVASGFWAGLARRT